MIKIFKDYNDFIDNKKPNENGVTKRFLHLNSITIKEINNIDCKDCWNCLECISCVACANCTYSMYCNSCLDSIALNNCKDCLDCDQCINGINLRKVSKSIDCANCRNVKYLLKFNGVDTPMNNLDNYKRMYKDELQINKLAELNKYKEY